MTCRRKSQTVPLDSLLDVLVDLLVQIAHVEAETRVLHSACVMSSTRRTLTPARYISIKASSTEVSRHRYHSMVAVSNGRLRSFGTCSVTSPAFV